MPKRKLIGLIGALGLVAQFVNGQLEPDCNPLHADCSAKKAWPEGNYYIDFTKETGPPPNWIIANNEVVKFTQKGAEFTYGKKGDAPNMWTDFYILGGRYDVELQIAPGQGIISSAVLWSDIQDEIDWEFSGNQHGEKPFPPPDGKWTVETNIFAQGKMWDGAATYQKDAYNPTTQFHTYSVEWDENHMEWYVDNQVVRSVQASSVPSGFILPQSPMKLQLGVWGGGDPANNYWTIQWAGGEIDMKGAPYTMYVRSVNITNKYPACQYKYKDKSGRITGIDKVQNGCSSSPSITASTIQPKIIKNSPGAETPSSVSSMGIYTSSLARDATGTNSAISSSPSNSSPVYPVSDTVMDEPAPASSVASSELTPSAIASGYPVASLSSTGGILSSLSSLLLGTSSRVSSIEALSTASINRTYPTTLPTAGSILVSKSSSASSGSSSMGLTTPATASIIPTLTVGNNNSSVGGIITSTISTVYSTNIYTITSCAPTVNNCTVGQVRTELISLTTTLCPVAGVTGSRSVASSNFDSNLPTLSGMSSMSSTLPSSLETRGPSLGSLTPPLSSAVAPFIFSNSSLEAMPTTYTFSSEIVTSFMSTVYSTNIITITSCAPTVKNCPVGQVTTETVSLYTTICPVTNTVIDGKTFSGQPSQLAGTIVATSSTLMSSLPTPIASKSSAYVVSSDSLATRITPSVGTSSSVYISSAMYKNTTVPPNGSPPRTHTQLSSTPVQLTTSTVYSTNVYTITSCAPTVTNCPARLGQVTTELVSLYTTICPIEQGATTGLQGTSNVPVGASASSIPSPSSTRLLNSPMFSAPTLTMSTAYTSSVYTVSSCAPGATECSSNIGSVTTELVPLHTTSGEVLETTQSWRQNSPMLYGTGSDSTRLSSTSAPPSSAPAAPVYTTSTVYSTNIYTITSCTSDATDCPGVLGAITTEIVAVSTTICPVSDETAPVSIPHVTASGYTTTEVTLSNTVSDSVIVITSIITFVDTPVPYSPTADIPTSSAAETAVAPYSSGIYMSNTRPCTTLTLGSYFTTVITYASLTQQPPPTSEVDVPSYTMTEIASTVEMGSSSTIVATETRAPDMTTITSSVTNTNALPSVPQGQQGGPGQCVCESTISTVYATVTVTVAETTITREPPFPSTYGTGTGAVPPGTGTSGYPTAKRRWFRRAQAGHGHGHGHY